MGAFSDYRARHETDDVPDLFHAIESIFAFFFLLEITLRIYVAGFAFFIGPGKFHNIFDFSWVCCQLYYVHIEIAHAGNSSTLLFVRMMCILRILRVLVLLDEPRLLISSIASAFKGL